MNNLKSFIFFTTLFIVAIVLSAAYSFSVSRNRVSLLTLKHSYHKESFVVSKTGELLSGDKLIGEFRAHDNNLGIIEIRFSTYGRISNDSFTFRLKERGDKEWYYTNTYKAKEFGGYPLFPFGFPIISNSKGKDYHFELESLYGKPRNAVGISTDEPVVVTKHKFNTHQLLADKKELFIFLFKKTKELIEDIDRDILYVFVLIYIVLISPFIVRRFISQKSILQLIRKLQAQTKKNTDPLLQLFSKLLTIVRFVLKLLDFIFRFLLKKLFSFHRWLQEE